MREELPPALARVADGLSRITEIVRSMKNFSHADQREMSEVDLNCAINSTLVVARSEYRDVADVDTDFGEIPRVTCHGGQINQVVLNLVVNAAHAIADVKKESGKRGVITVRTRADAGHVVISVSDTGGGIRDEIRHRVFDPFFTTKEVGRGSGQGLTMARSVVVKGHGGEIDFDTEVGTGTTFTIRLPTDPEQIAAQRQHRQFRFGFVAPVALAAMLLEKRRNDLRIGDRVCRLDFRGAHRRHGQQRHAGPNRKMAGKTRY